MYPQNTTPVFDAKTTAYSAWVLKHYFRETWISQALLYLNGVDVIQAYSM